MSCVRTVVGIIRRENKILVAKRPLNKPYSGYYEFPGGKIEAHESSEAALARELYEELGIEEISAHFLFSHTHTYPDKMVNLEIWQVENFVGEPYARENQTLSWVTLSDLSHLPLLEGNKAIISKL